MPQSFNPKFLMQRRKFIQRAGALALSPYMAQSLISCGSGNQQSEEKSTSTSGDLSEFGIQLWTVKEDMAADPKGTLSKIASAGYNYVESFGGDKGPFWGMTAAEFKAVLDDLGMRIVASHVDAAYTTDLAREEEFKTLAYEAASIGMKYLSNPFPGEIQTKEEWMAVAEGLNRQGIICASNGIKAGYHNHHFEFLPLEDGTLPYNLLLDNTDPDLVDFELDLYWAVKAGQDPEKWLNEHGTRIKLCHVKDLAKPERMAEIDKEEGPAEGFWPLQYSCVLGTGQIDYPKILKTARDNGMEYYIVEQERFDGSNPLADAALDAEYMKSFRFAS